MTDSTDDSLLDHPDKEPGDPSLTAVGELRAIIEQLVSRVSRVSREHDRAQVVAVRPAAAGKFDPCQQQASELAG